MIIQKKLHKKDSKNVSQYRHILKFGEFGVKSVSFGRLNEEQIKSIVRLLLQKIKLISNNSKSWKVWNLLFLNSNLTKLSSESRMGKGKGSIYTKAVFVKSGTMLFEFSGLSNQQISEIFSFIKKKIPLKIMLIKKRR